jgi:hypothetical protein
MMTGSDLKNHRIAAKLSRPALALKASLHPDSIKYWERKDRIDIRGWAPSRIIDALGLSGSTMGNLSTPTRTRHGVLEDTGVLCSPKRCGAKTRQATPCQIKVVTGKNRCRLHGGLSTGPKTAEGRQRIREAQRKRWTDNNRTLEPSAR